MSFSPFQEIRGAMKMAHGSAEDDTGRRPGPVSGEHAAPADGDSPSPRRRPAAVDIRPGKADTTTPGVDLILGLVAVLAAFFILAAVDAFNLLYELSRSHEDWHLGELILSTVVLGFVGSWFACRRWRQARGQIRARAEVDIGLHSSLEDIDYLFSASSSAFYTCKAGGDFTTIYVSPGVTEQTGHPPEAFMLDSTFWVDNIHPDDKNRVLADLARLYEGDYHSDEYRFRSPDGSYRWMSDRLKLIRDGDGNPKHVVGIWADITAQRGAGRQPETAVAATVVAATTKLRERESFLALIADSLPISITYVDLDLRYWFVNRTGAAWRNRSKDDIIGKTILEVLGPTNFALLRDYLERVCQGTDQTFETTMTLPDGVTRHLQCLYLPDRDENGVTRGAVAMVMDMTDRKRAEDDLRRQRAELELILNNLPTRLFVKDDKNRVLRVNEPAARSVGMTVAEVEGANAYDLFADAAKMGLDDDLAVIAAGQPKLGIIEPYMPRNGQRGWVRTDKVLCTHPETGERLILVVAADITAEKTAEDALRRTEARYRSLYDRTPVMLHSIDVEGRLLSVSEFWLDKMGYRRDEVIGRKSIEFLTPDSARKAIEEALPDFLLTGVCHDVAYQMVTKSGELLDVLLSAVAEHDENGGFVRSMAVLIDVTERRRVERQSIRTQKTKSIGNLTGGLAHDFN